MNMRDSGVPWLGDIPTHWPLVPVRYLLSLGPKNGISPPQAGNDGVLSFSISAVRDGRVLIEGHEKLVTLEQSVAREYYVKAGDILLVRGNGNLSLVGTCGLIETALDECTYPDILMLMRAGHRVRSEFLVAALNAPYVRGQIESLAQTTNGTYKLSGEDVRTLCVAVPPLAEQRSIVAHLSRETSRLDALLAAKQRLLDLLAEKRKAIISTAVTRGLDPKVKLRDSGVPWLGEIPEHWESKRMKYLFRLVADKAPVENDFELLSLYTDIGVKPRRELEERGNKASSTDEYWLVQPGDLVVNKLLAWMGAFGVSEYCGVTSPAYDILRPHEGVESFFYHHLFRCGVATTEVRARSYGIMDMRLRLYFDRLGDMYVPVPPHDEQRAIVAHIARETAKLDAVRAATERTIALLKERRSALIAAAVTGQLDVGTAA